MAAVNLQSQDHRDLLDIIDKLRLQGVSKYIDLPEIVVCGDQSAGKSSVLEAISRMSFPTKDNLCTRFATELVLRRDVVPSVRVSIIPADDRSKEEHERLSAFQVDFGNGTVDLAAAVEAAKQAMDLSETKVFSKDTLRVELSGPAQPHLTLVDLPGIFRAGSKDQSVEDANTVRDMVRGYMMRQRSIILAVVSAKSDYALQEVTELAMELDPTGSRTLGLITKPDTLDAGSDSEAFFTTLARNTDVVLRLGWHVLVNRSFKTKDATSDERDESETKFFNSGVWASLDDRVKGVTMLVSRLSHVLTEQILQQLPSLLREVEEGIYQCQLDKKRLGTTRISVEDHRRYLLQVSQSFSTLIKSASDGVYTDPFFGDVKTDSGYRRRLRAVVQNTLSDFASEMRVKGHSRSISDDAASGIQHQEDETHVSWSDYVHEVKTLMRRSRGRELPGTFNPLLIGELFAEQSRPWEGIVTKVKLAIEDAVHYTIKYILAHVATGDTGNGIFRIVSGRLSAHIDKADRKVAELLEPHQNSHPITYNHYLTDSVQKAQAARNARQFEKTFKQALGIPNFNGDSRYRMFPLQLLNRLQQRTQVDMERYASELAADYMQAYYKVALKKFIDDFSVLAVEQCLIRELASLFDPQIVYNMEETDILKLTAESEETVRERARCLDKLTALEVALLELRRLERYRSLESNMSCYHISDPAELRGAELLPADEANGELPLVLEDDQTDDERPHNGLKTPACTEDDLYWAASVPKSGKKQRK